MQVDNCLILSAGKGTRMGEVGKILPKILWPVFEKNILDLQIAFAKRFNIKSIYVNAHHLSEQLITYSKQVHPEVNILYEDTLLDIGGAIHNVASKINYTGSLLVLNGDQFLMYDEELFSKGVNKMDFCTACLFVIEKNTNEGYNAFSFEGSKIIDLTQNSELSRDKKMHTYSGMSIINLERLKPTPGISKYFESVADYKNDVIESVELDDYEYWDFGTIPRYLNSMFGILKEIDSDSEFIKFLKENDAINLKKINKASYNSTSSRIINLSDKEIVAESDRVIFISGDCPKEFNDNSIYFEGKCSKILPQST